MSICLTPPSSSSPLTLMSAAHVANFWSLGCLSPYNAAWVSSNKAATGGSYRGSPISVTHLISRTSYEIRRDVFSDFHWLTLPIQSPQLTRCFYNTNGVFHCFFCHSTRLKSLGDLSRHLNNVKPDVEIGCRCLHWVIVALATAS
jgi:hypothetical protein